jgi:hypothetical protein
MTDLTRMTRSDETPEELRALLAHAERPAPLTAEDRAKILAGAAAIVAGATVTTTAVAATTTAVRASMLSSGFFVKVVGLAAVVATVGLGTRSLVHRPAQRVASSVSSPARAAPTPAARPQPPPASPPVLAPAAQPEATPPRLLTPVVAPAPPSSALVRVVSARVAPRVAEPVAEPVVRRPTQCPVEQGAVGLAHESRVLAMATAALASDPATAAACVRVLDRATTSDALRDELLFVGFDAARRLGRAGEARRYAEALVARSPSSSYAARAQRWLEQR